MYVDEFLATVYKIQYAFSSLSIIHMTNYMYPPEKPVSDEDTFDFIVIGSGSAGSVLANRLTEDPNMSVMLLEAGPVTPLESNIAGTVNYLINSTLDWRQVSVKDKKAYPCLRNNQMPLTRGKVLGGTSSINIMYYTRGDPSDTNLWADMVNDQSWNYTNVLPYFIKSERLEEPSIINSYYGQFHGTEGYLGVTKPHKEVTTNYFKAYEEIGYKQVPDTNGNYTLGMTEQMVTLAGGLRQSTANSFLSTIKERPNLYVLTETLVVKIIIDKNKKATGVQVLDKNNNKFVLNARKEVILSAGAISSPHLLMLSGIGPKQHLKSFNIKVVADLPVGKKLQNHFPVSLIYKMGKASIGPPMDPKEFPMPAISGYRALKKNQNHPDFQILTQILNIDGFMVFCNFVFSYNKELCEHYYKVLKDSEIYMLTIVKMHARSHGVVSLNSADPLDSPSVHLDPYADEADFKDMLSYIDDVSQIVNTTFFKSVNATLVTLPECAKFNDGSDEYYKCYARCACSSFFHYGSSCAMGSVVDSRLRVYGIKSLRVVDASVMPVVASGNTNAPTIMIAEKAADMIKEDNNMPISPTPSKRTGPRGAYSRRRCANVKNMY